MGTTTVSQVRDEEKQGCLVFILSNIIFVDFNFYVIMFTECRLISGIENGACTKLLWTFGVSERTCTTGATETWSQAVNRSQSRIARSFGHTDPLLGLLHLKLYILRSRCLNFQFWSCTISFPFTYSSMCIGLLRLPLSTITQNDLKLPNFEFGILQSPFHDEEVWLFRRRERS